MIKYPFTLENALKVQAIHLANWKTLLLPHVYEALEEWAKLENEFVTDPRYVKRGEDLSVFVENFSSREKTK